MDINNQEKKIDALIKSHGKRIQPDELMSKRAHKNIQAHWHKSLHQKKIRARNRIFQIAAVITLMITTVFFVQNSYRTDYIELFANSSYQQGSVLMTNDEGHWNALSEDSITIGLNLKTESNSFVTLNLTDNSQLRLNGNTEIKIVDASSIELITGEIYHDADLSNSKSPLSISTNYGIIQHLGTRYKVKLLDKELDVAVRNGLVSINNNQGSKNIKAGVKLTIDKKGSYNSAKISAYDASWNWTKLAAKPFDSDNQNLHDFIIWFAHENGFEVEWNNTKQQTRNVKLAGNLKNIDSSDLIKTVFLSTKFDYKINNGILSIR